VDTKHTQSEHSHTQIGLDLSNCNTPAEPVSKLVCAFCKKNFKSTTSKYRHQRTYCKIKKEQSTLNTLVEQNNDLIKKDKERELKINKMTEQVNKLLNKICDFNSINKSNINSHNNTQNNTLNNNSVKINNFGEENLSYITKEIYKEMLTNPRDSIPKLIDQIHFHFNHPENSNIRIPNKKQPFAEIYKNNRWIVCNQYRTVCGMLRDKKDMLHDIYIKTQEELTHTERDKYLDYKEDIDRDLFTVKHVLTDIRATILSGTRNNVNTIEYINTTNQIKDVKRDPTDILMEQIPEDFLYQ